MVAVANGGGIQVSTAPRGNAPRPPVFHGGRSEGGIDKFFWRVEAYFGAMGVKDDA